MDCSMNLERWDWPIFRAEPSGFEDIAVSISCPSSPGKVKAVMTLEKAKEFGERLLKLTQALEQAPGRQ